MAFGFCFVNPRNNSGPVRATITKCGPRMQKSLVKVPIVWGGGIDHDLQGQIELKSQDLSHFELVRTITHYPFQLGSPNLDQRRKIAWLRSLSFWIAIDLDLQGQIRFKKSIFLVSPLLEIHNHHITTREPSVPRLLHKPDCFMVIILCAYLYIIYLDCFTVPTVSPSRTRCTHTDLGSRGYFGVYRRSCCYCYCQSVCVWGGGGGAFTG